MPKPEGNAQIGDILIADVTVRDGDRVLSEMKEYRVRVDAKLAFKDGVADHFGEQVKGANAGDKRHGGHRPVRRRSADAVAARPDACRPTFEIKDVKTLRLPELTHEFLHNFGVHSPEQFDELIRVVLEAPAGVPAAAVGPRSRWSSTSRPRSSGSCRGTC